MGGPIFARGGHDRGLQLIDERVVEEIGQTVETPPRGLHLPGVGEGVRMTGGNVGSGVDVSWAHQGAEEVVVERRGRGV